MPEITNEPLLPVDLTLEKFKADFMEHGPVPSLARYYGVDPAQIFTLALKYNLSLRKLSSERVRYKAKKAYELMAKKLGHYPTSHEIRQDKESKKLYGAIRRLFGTLNGFREAYGYPIPPDPSIARAKALYKDYLALGTLEKVAKKHNITSSTAGQTLRQAGAKGLFKYPPEKPGYLSHITPEKLKADYMLYGSISNIAAHYGINPGEVNRLARKHNLSIKKIVAERAKNRLVEDYKKILANLGHHPTATELQHLLKNLYSRILHHYKSIDNFRKTYGYPTHEKGIPGYTDYLKRLYNTNRENILKCLKIKPGITRPEIVRATGVTYPAVRNHVSKLINEGIVYDAKEGLSHHCFLKNPDDIAKDEKELKLSDLKPAMNLKDKAFIHKLTGLYLRYGNLDTVTKKMDKDKTLLLSEIDRLLKAGYLIPIKTRKMLILALRLKRDYDKIGSTIKVGKIYGLSSGTVSEYLNFGHAAGLFKYSGIRTKRTKHIAKKNDSYSTRNIKLMLRIKKEYDKHHSIRKAAQKYNLSFERISQILTAGSDIGLFEYPLKKRSLSSRVKREDLRANFLKYKSIPKLSRHYRVSIGQVKEALDKHGLSVADMQLELSRIDALNAYQKLVNELGHHPSTTEIRKRQGYLLRRIKKIWGSVYIFRKEYNFPSPKMGPPLLKN